MILVAKPISTKEQLLLQIILCALSQTPQDFRPGPAAPFHGEKQLRGPTALCLSHEGCLTHAPAWEEVGSFSTRQTNRNGPREQVKVLKQEFIPSKHVGMDSYLRACVTQQSHTFQSRSHKSLMNSLPASALLLPPLV